MPRYQRKSSIIVSVGIFNNCIGIGVVRSGYPAISAQTKVFNAMGFESKEEYTDTYPGQFCNVSDNTIEAMRHLGFPDNFAKGAAFDILHEICIFNKPWRKRFYIEDLIRGTFGSECIDKVPMFVLQPTVSDILSTDIPQISTQCLVQKLWFCSDWKEEGDYV